MINRYILNKDNQESQFYKEVKVVLIGFMAKLASHFERSALERRTTMSLRPVVQTVLPALP